jgi:aspartyl/asparaginyl beta-hydroxylase (cupin superfamily)
VSAGRGDPASAPIKRAKTDGAAAPARFPLFFYALHAVERVFVRFSVHGAAEMHRNEDFPWVPALEAAWPAIRAELDAVMQRDEPIPPFQAISPEQAAITQDERWRTYVLYAYGARATRNCRECPATAAAVEHIPGMKSALFSILSPGKHIPPHRGPYKGLLRCHLGLRIPGPPGAARLRVGATHSTWAEGRALVFDDTLEHEVWNDSAEDRVVLFIDFLRPMRPPMGWINDRILKWIVGSPFGRANIARFKAWYRARGIDADV